MGLMDSTAWLRSAAGADPAKFAGIALHGGFSPEVLPWLSASATHDTVEAGVAMFWLKNERSTRTPDGGQLENRSLVKSNLPGSRSVKTNSLSVA